MKIFCLDRHISVIADLKKIWGDMGHEVVDWTLSGHAHIMGRSQDVLRLAWSDGDIPKHRVGDRFYEVYKDDLRDIDAFACCYPPLFAMLYERWEKPIILQIPIRYEHPLFGDDPSKPVWDQWLREHVDSGQVIPCANSKYDAEWFESNVGRPARHIPSLCEYTGMDYRPVDGAWLYYYKGTFRGMPGNILKKEHALPSGYKWCDLVQFRGTVHFPYQVSTMSIFEQYTANIPMMFPSQEFLGELYAHGQNVLSEVGQVDWSTIPLADYYDTDWMPHIQYFDRMEHLYDMAKTVNVKGVSEAMREHNTWRKQEVYSRWEAVLNSL
jgi:hypothetical protein